MSIANDTITTNENTINPFGPDNVITFFQSFDGEKMILKAMAALISTADLEGFGQSDELRWGLQQLFELICKKQESRVEDLYNQAINSPEYIIKEAQEICDSYSPGGCGSCKSLVLKSLKGLDAVIDNFGTNPYSQASVLRERLSAIADQTPGGAL